MLLILIPAAWLVVMFFGLAMCRLAASSDAAYAVAMTAWIARAHPGEKRRVVAQIRARERPPDAHGGTSRAAG